MIPPWATYWPGPKSLSVWATTTESHTPEARATAAPSPPRVTVWTWTSFTFERRGSGGAAAALETTLETACERTPSSRMETNVGLAITHLAL